MREGEIQSRDHQTVKATPPISLLAKPEYDPRTHGLSFRLCKHPAVEELAGRADRSGAPHGPVLRDIEEHFHVAGWVLYAVAAVGGLIAKVGCRASVKTRRGRHSDGSKNADRCMDAMRYEASGRDRAALVWCGDERHLR